MRCPVLAIPMIRISILYPNTADSHFDHDYYAESHMPMSIKLLSAHPGYHGVSVERGLAGVEPNSAPAYAAMCHFLFDSVEDFVAAFTPHAAALQADIPEYTNVSPVIQFNEVVMSA